VIRKLLRVARLASLLGLAAVAIGKLRQGSSPVGEHRAPPSVDTWPEVPRRD
jgi:hypothetical protein